MVMEEQVSDMELASESIPVPQVQEPIVDTIKRTNKSGISRGKPRLRKKALHASILKQMEFYFSNANLSKDRYLSGLLKESPYINLEVFTRCNKLRELTTDINRIAKALEGSTILKVSEDGTKVSRITPIEGKENVDECTVYVQNLPPDADHDWLISIFSKFGPVDYVSIPRYKSNRKIKGFAFVEFDLPSSAQECIKMFRKKGCVLPSYTSPNEVLSITTFEEPKKIIGYVIESKKKTKNNDTLETSNKEIENENNIREMNTDDNSKQNFKKRKYSSEKSFVTDENVINIKIKKKKREESEDKDNDKTCDNEKDATDNNDRQNTKKRKHNSEKLFVADENNIKIKEKNKKVSDQNITDQQNEEGKSSKKESENKDNTCDNETDYNDKQNTKKRKHSSEKLFLADESNIKSKKKRKTIDQSITNQQNEKETVSKEEFEDIDNNEIDTTENGQQNLKKRKLTSEKLCIIDEKDTKVSITGNNTENQETPTKNRNKITEKKKRILTINDTIIAEDTHGEVVKKDCQEPKYDSNETNKANASSEKHSTRDFSTANSDIEEVSIDERKKKKNRKKRSKIQDNDICSMIGLQIMAKTDWKRLRNRYLDLQRSKMSQLKLHLRKTEMERDGIMTKKGWHCDKLKQENDNEKLDEEEKPYGRVNYAPGIIVKIEMNEPCIDIQGFKMELKNHSSVKYIDITPNSCEAFVRCDTAEAAQSFAQKSYEGRRLTVLEGDEETSYWDKISRDRLEKVGKKKRVKQRGRNKLLKRAEKELGKCIKFDQD
ncbi:hypothetical protein P5V15_012959 [Pogonomyrmex californicus]